MSAEHFVDEEIDDVAAAASEPADEVVAVLDSPKGERRQVEAGGPALDPRYEIVDVVPREAELEPSIQELFRFVRGEAELIGAHLAQRGVSP